MHGRARGKGKLVVRAKLNRNMKLAGCPSLVGRSTHVRNVSDKYRSNCAKGKCCDERGALCWYSKNGKVRYGNAKANDACCEDGVTGDCKVIPVIASLAMVNTSGVVNNPNNSHVMVTFSVAVDQTGTRGGSSADDDLVSDNFNITLSSSTAALAVGALPSSVTRISSSKYLLEINYSAGNGSDASGVQVLNVAPVADHVKAKGVTPVSAAPATAASIRLVDSFATPKTVTFANVTTTSPALASTALRSVIFNITASTAADVNKVKSVIPNTGLTATGSLAFTVAEIGRDATAGTITLRADFAAATASSGDTFVLAFVGNDNVKMDKTVTIS